MLNPALCDILLNSDVEADALTRVSSVKHSSFKGQTTTLVVVAKKYW